MDVVALLGFLFVAALAFAGFGAWIAGEKGRGRTQGVVIGFLFGPLGVLILAMLPNRPTPTPRPAGATRRSVGTIRRDVEDPRPRKEDEEDLALRYLGGD